MNDQQLLDDLEAEDISQPAWEPSVYDVYMSDHWDSCASGACTILTCEPGNPL